MTRPGSESKGRDRIAILLIEDHPLVGELLRAICAEMPGFEVIAHAVSAAQGLQEAKRVQPQIAVVDIGLPDGSGLELTRQLRRHVPGAKVIVLSAREDAQAVLDAMAAGAAAYLAKSSGAEHIREALELVAAGELAFTSEQEAIAAGGLATRARHASESTRVAESLTARQRMVLSMLADGRSAREIAERLGISERTVRSHVTALYRRLDVSNRVQAVNRALSLRLIPRDPRTEWPPR